MSPAWFRVVALLPLLAAAAACNRSFAPGDELGTQPSAIDPKTGGQSGGEGSVACERREEPAETAVSDGKRVHELVDELESALQAGPELKWWPRMRGRDPIAPTRFELVELSLGDSVTVGCSTADASIQLRVRSEDGELDARFAGELTAYTSAGALLQLSAPLVDGGLREGPTRAGLGDVTLLLELSWHEGDVTGTLGALDAGDPIAYIGQTGPGWEATDLGEARPLRVSELQRSVCAAISETSPATFETEEALRQSLAKRWVACAGTARVDPDFAGFEIHADGRWHELRVERDALVAAQGFGHEGVMARNVFGDDFNLAILDWLPGSYEFAHAGLSADGATLRIQAQATDSELDATFQATDLPVRYPPQSYQAGARVGLAACDAREADVTSRPASESDLLALLAGRWTFCGGGFGTQHAGVEFSTDGTSYSFLDADGARVASGQLQIIDTSSQNGPGVFQIDLELGDHTLVLHPVFASTPVKMLAQDEYRSVLGGS
jgi:hypothetical protein